MEQYFVVAYFDNHGNIASLVALTSMALADQLLQQDIVDGIYSEIGATELTLEQAYEMRDYWQVPMTFV